MTQPTLTKRLQYIEEEFQTRIVSRSTKGVVFTREGEYLAHQAELYLQFRGGINRRMEAFKKEGVETIRISSSITFSKRYLPQLIRSFQQEYPKVSFDVQIKRSQNLSSALLDGTADLAFSRGEYGGDLNKKKLIREQASVVNLTSLTRRQLLEHCQVRCLLGENSQKMLNRWWNERFDRNPGTLVTVQFVDVAWNMVKNGVGYTIGFFDRDKIRESGFWHQPIAYQDGTPVERETWLIYPKNTEKSPLVSAFIQLVEHTYHV